MSIDYRPSSPVPPGGSWPGRHKILTAPGHGVGLLRAARSEVTRVPDTVEEHPKEQTTRRPATGRAPAAAHRAHPAGRQQPAGRRARRVRGVMTTSVVTVDRNTPYKRIARLLTEHRISGLAVLTMRRQVAGTALRPSPERAGRRKTSTVISSRVTIPPTWDVDGWSMS